MQCSRGACLWTGVIILILDAISKYWVHSFLPLMSARFPSYPYGGIAVFENFLGVEFSLTHLTNRGAAWGVLDGYQDVLVFVRILLIFALIIYLWKYCKIAEWRLPLSLVVAGALGNVIDYYIYGHVVDMFHFILWGYHFPVFNVADSAVCIGICWLIGLSALQDLKVKAN
jgi:signal peptidase II